MEFQDDSAIALLALDLDDPSDSGMRSSVNAMQQPYLENNCAWPVFIRYAG